VENEDELQREELRDTKVIPVEDEDVLPRNDQVVDDLRENQCLVANDDVLEALKDQVEENHILEAEEDARHVVLPKNHLVDDPNSVADVADHQDVLQKEVLVVNIFLFIKFMIKLHPFHHN
jgi:hypothetical protein